MPMVIRPRTIIAACGVGPDLHLAIVEASALGVRVRTGPVVRDALTATIDIVRRAATGLPRAATVVFVCPAELTAMRPIGVDTKGFVAARADLHKSVGRLVPIPPENALIGLIQRHGDDGAGESAGYLSAARKDAIDAWADRIRAITGRTPDAVLTPAMALIGCGAQRTETFVALERTLSGAPVAHTLRFGQAVDLASPIDSDRLASVRSSGARVRWVPSGDGAASTDGIDAITPAELAIAGAMAMIMGDGEFVPLAGAPPRNAPRWVAAAAALLAAGVLAWGAMSVRSWRYERAIDRLTAEEATLDAEVARVQAMRNEAARLSALVRDGVAKTAAAWSPRTSDLAAASMVIPDGGFLYRLSATGAGVVIEGEAPKASAVLAALEASPRFTRARQQDPTAAVPMRSTESFGIRADYEPAAPPTPTTTGGAP
jgi:hypothetical protein